ncbi:flippase [Halorientalis marina]|uniref:flippase n=1 Tax=Halorientalis marina TaxID=2931976 RepID=UPI001FF1FD4A|nr:flippase [Halorientalis marina]
MELKISTIKVFVAKNGMTILSFAGLAFFAQKLGASQMGVFFLFQALLGVVSLPTSLGFSRSVEKHVSSSNNPELYFVSGLAVQFTMVVVMILIAFVFSDRITDYLGRDLITYFIIGLVLKPLSGITFSALKGELRVGESASVELAKQFAWVSVGAGLLLLGFDVTGIIIGLLAGFGVKLFWSAYKLDMGWRSLRYRPTERSVRSLLSFAGRDLVGQLGPFLYSWTDILLLGFFLSSAQVGAYEIAWRVAGTTNQLTQALTTTVFPQISSWSEENAVEKIEELLPDLVLSSVILVIPAFFGSILLGEEVLTFVFGAEYATAWLVLIVFMLRQIISGFTSIFDVILASMDYPELRSIATVIGVLLNIVFNTVFIILFGLIGAAVATTLSVIFHTVLTLYFLSDKIQFKIPKFQMGWCIFSSLGMTLILFPIVKYVNIRTLASLSAVVLFGVIVYGIFIMGSPTIRNKVINNSVELIPNKLY